MEILLERLCTLSVHTSSHCPDEVILNPDLFGDLSPNDLIVIYDPEHPACRIFTRVPATKHTGANRLEVSMLKSISEAINLKPFSKVIVSPCTRKEATLDFVELSFKRQYLQRGNMLRFKTALLERTIHMNQHVSAGMSYAQVQDLRAGSAKTFSGLVTAETKFVFRSKSARVIWLVQISAEMWDVDTVRSSRLNCIALVHDPRIVWPER